MKKDYRFGLLGLSLGHSLSAPIHQAALESLGLSGCYSLFPCTPEKLQSMLNQMRQGILDGLNVTIPYKQTIIQWLDELTPTAKAIGAVNTIFLDNKKLFGDNTDAPGFLSDLQASDFSAPLFHQSNGSVLVLGAGGSAHAIVYALMVFEKPIIIAARRLAQAVELTASMMSLNRPRTPPLHPIKLSGEELSKVISSFSPIQLIVNTTPVGMKPLTADTPWPSDLSLPATAAIYDLVYNPPRTRFLEKGQRENLAIRNGLGMLVDQAALAFQRWTDIHPPREPMFQSAIAALTTTT